MKKKIIIVIVIISVISLLFIKNSFATETPGPSITIQSEKLNYNNQEGGAWQVTKSAKWIEKGKARITIDVETITKSNKEYKDYILVLDTSASMEGNKINIVKSNAKELINNILSEEDNRIGIISFSTEATILSELTDDISCLDNQIDSITPLGDTNYYRALVSADKVLAQVRPNKDAVLLFLTDGYPNINTPNEVAQYNYLKNKYENVTITGIQYEMGKTVLTPLKKISDNQYISDMDNIHNVLFDSIKKHALYEQFTIKDIINNDIISNIHNIRNNKGTFSINRDEIIWNLNEMQSGDLEPAQLSFDVELKKEFLNIDNTFKTNSATSITTIIDDIEENINTTTSPIISNQYQLEYDLNLPSNCQIPNDFEPTRHFVYDLISLKNKKMTCKDYYFKNWEIITENVSKINDDYMIMPEKNVKLRGVWSKLNISKKAEGTVHEVLTLYGAMKEQGTLDSIKSTYVNRTEGINFSSIASNSNGKGVYEISSTKEDTYPVYYYRGTVDNNNILFADMCFKAVISTPTGGVKMIYNGLPTAEGVCNNTGTSSQIATNYYSKTVRFADVGYIPGINHAYENKEFSRAWYTYLGRPESKKTIYQTKTGMASSNFYYADSIKWDNEKNKFVLFNSDETEVIKSTWESNYSKLKGKYTCFSATLQECQTAYFIGHGISTTAYYFTLTKDNNNTKRYLSNNLTYNAETNQYTLDNPIDVSTTWYTAYGTYANKGYFFCNDLKSTTCENPFYVFTGTTTTVSGSNISDGETYDNLLNQAKQVKWKFGNSIDENGKLKDVIEIPPIEWANYYNKISSNHYTCFSSSDECDGNTVGYIYYSNSTMVRYMPVPKNQNIETVLEEMLDFNEDKKPSTIKGDINTSDTIDYWYYHNIEKKGFSKYVEDTVFCNDRSSAIKNGWEPNGGVTTGYYLFFGPYNRTAKPTINCPRDKDKFTVSSEIGNGLLDYPVGLLTADEARFAGASSGINNSYYLYTGQLYWLGSPYSFHTNGIDYWQVSTNGSIGTADVYQNKKGVRPVISLKPNSIISQGDGSPNYPYQIEMEDD